MSASDLIGTIMDASSETIFEDTSLLVSRTDTRGVILSANKAFQEVCAMPMSELINAPHKIIRHPDMPKGVFWFLWSRLLAQKPISAYVKNKTGEGNFYWVYATIAPLEGGFISMRIKPLADRVAKIEALYTELLDIEQKQNITPKESAAKLSEMLRRDGYSDFEDFMANSAATETANRLEVTDQPIDQRIKQQTFVLERWAQVKQECEKVSQAYVRLSTTSSNLQIQAAALNEKGRGMNEISKNFAILAKKINSELANLSFGATEVETTVRQVILLNSVGTLLSEADEIFKTESGGNAHDNEKNIIAKQRRLYAERADDAMMDVSRQLDRFFQRSEDIKRSLIGLSVTRTMCAIENASINHQGDSSIPAIIEELSRFQGIADSGISVIEGRMKDVRKAI